MPIRLSFVRMVFLLLTVALDSQLEHVHGWVVMPLPVQSLPSTRRCCRGGRTSRPTNFRRLAHRSNNNKNNNNAIIQQPNTNHESSSSSSLHDNRRRLLHGCFFALAGGLTAPVLYPSSKHDNNFRVEAAAADVVVVETIGKDPDCNDRTCLGVWDGLLADCPAPPSSSAAWKMPRRYAGCVSSQDDRPGIFLEPMDYADEIYTAVDTPQAVDALVDRILDAIYVVAPPSETVTVQVRQGRYLRVLFRDASSSTSIGEFYVTPNDTTVQFRVAAIATTTDDRSSGGSSGSRRSLTTAATSTTNTFRNNMDRVDQIRRTLRFSKLVVLRNRKRSLWFGESDFDTFGPGSGALGSPAEMRPGELEGRNDDNDSNHSIAGFLGGRPTRVDVLQQFPRQRQ